MKKTILVLLVGLLIIAPLAMARDVKTKAGGTVEVEPVEPVYAYDSNGNLEYIGKAAPGTATSEAAWQIQKLIYTDGNLTKIAFANNQLSFSFVWDSREGYTYE